MYNLILIKCKKIIVVIFFTAFLFDMERVPAGYPSEAEKPGEVGKIFLKNKKSLLEKSLLEKKTLDKITLYEI